MLYHIIIRSGEAGQTIVDWIDTAATAIEVLAVLIIVLAIFYSVLRYVWQKLKKKDDESPYRALKVSLGQSMLLGLEILVAADIVRTVALEDTLASVLILGLLVLIRTFLSWALAVEIDGHWPWQSAPEKERVAGK